jgi:hypothetical protein
MSNFQKDDGTGMTPPPAAGSASGAVTSRDATRKHPKQGGIKPRMKIDVNSHGIRRETSLDLKPKKTRPKKV